jgi:hypothetical protein
MSSSASAPPVYLELKPERSLAALLVFAHALALAVTAGAGLPPLMGGTLTIMITASAALGLYRHYCLAAACSVRALSWRADGRWLLRGAQGWSEARLEQAWCLSLALILLAWRDADGRRRRAWLRPRPGEAGFRRLAVRLRWDRERSPPGRTFCGSGGL